MGTTVFVVGAGASTEFDFSKTMPVGEALARQIEELLNRELVMRNDGPIATSIMSQIGGYHQKHIAAIRTIRDRVHAYDSIDRFLSEWSETPHLTEIAKLCIAHLMLEAERKSHLKQVIDKSESAAVELRKLNGSWLGVCAAKANQSNPDIKRRDPRAVFSDVAFVTFNYDRCIEQYLFSRFTIACGLEPEDAIDAINSIPIEHVYGSLGKLPYGSRGIEFGAPDRFINHAASEISTFNEPVTQERIHRIRGLISNAEKIVFLGCAYHRPNLSVLFAKDSPPPEIGVWGTALKLRPQQVSRVNQYFTTCRGTFSDQSCSDLLTTYQEEIFGDPA